MKRLIAIAGLLVCLAAPFPGDAQEKSKQEAKSPAIEKVEAIGGSVRKIAQKDDRLEVDFHLQGKSVKDEDLALLGQIDNVVHLHLGKTNISDAGLAHLKGLTSLTRLHLEGTKITDAGLAQLKDLGELTYLNLYGTAVSDAGLAHLEGLSKLKNLYVWQTKVSDQGVAKLRKAIKDLKVDTGWDLEEVEKIEAAAKEKKPPEEP